MELFDYDPNTGIRSLWHYDSDTGKGVFRREQDVTWAVEWAKKMRREGVTAGQSKKDDYMALHAVIPPGVEMELRQKGINIYDPNCTKRLLEEIERNYNDLKVTDKVHIATR